MLGPSLSRADALQRRIGWSTVVEGIGGVCPAVTAVVADGPALSLLFHALLSFFLKKIIFWCAYSLLLLLVEC